MVGNGNPLSEAQTDTGLQNYYNFRRVNEGMRQAIIE